MATASTLICVLVAASPDQPNAAAFSVEGSSRWVDPAATERGVDVRIGAQAQGWSATVDDLDGSQPQVRVDVHGPNNAREQREFTLTGETEEARSRELAAMVSLLIEETEPTPQTHTGSSPEPIPPPTTSKPERHRPIWWLGGGPRLELGSPQRVSPSGGIGARAGMWLYDYYQPLFELEWMGSQQNSSLHALTLGAGLAVGTWLPRARRWWVGGGAVPHLEVVVANGATRRTEAVLGADLVAIGQLRHRNFLFGLRTGIALNAPTVAVAGDGSVIVWNTARWMLGLTVAWVWGDQRE